MKRKLYVGLSSFLVALTAIAGQVTLGWDTYTSDPAVDTLYIYVLKGTNTSFAIGNTNATYKLSISSTNTSITISNLPSGGYTFTTTAYSTSLGLESSNATPVSAVVPVAPPTNLKVNNVSNP